MPFVDNEQVMAQDGEIGDVADEPAVGELIDKRTENSKTSYLGGGSYSLDSSIGVIHYKDDYASATEKWKNIDLTPVEGKTKTEMVVKTAPYELTIDGLNVTVKDKKTGSITTLKLTDIGTATTGSTAVATPILTFANGKATAKDVFTDTDLEISWENSRINYTRILKSANAPSLAKFDISQTGTGITITTKAEDSKTADDKSVPVISEIKGGVLTENIDTTTHTLSYPVRIDPTLDIIVNLGTDDCYTENSVMYETRTYINIGKVYADNAGWRFRSVTIPNGSNVTDAWLDIWAASSQAVDTVRTKLSGEQSATSATFSTLADYDGRTLTTAQVDWDFTTDWGGNYAYDSLGIKTIIQELVDDYSGLSSANITIFCKDDGSTAGAVRQIWTYEGWAPYAVSLHVVYTLPVLAVTSSAASSVTNTTAIFNGSATIGSSNITLRGFAWGTTSNTTDPVKQVPPASYSSNNTASGNWGTGAFTYAATGLSTGTTYYYRAYAYDGTTYDWGDQVSFLTMPAAPTSVAATDGTDPSKVVITWTKSTGATNYYVFRGATQASGTLGDVATYDDTGGGAPTITAGTASASDGTSVSYVTLSVAGEVGNNGASYDYKVRASNASGNSTDSSTNAGYRGTTTLTYDWQRSAADSDASYSSTGNTTDPANDPSAPSDGSGRYYKVTVAMTGASSNTTLANRGYRIATDISNTPATKSFGVIAENTAYYAGSAPADPVADGTCTFNVTNTGSVAIDISTHGHDFTGGVGWALTSDYPMTMADPFTDNSFNTTNFTESTNAGSLVVEANSRLELASNANISGFVRSTNSYQLAETQTIIKVSQQSTDGGFKLCPTVVTDHQWDVYSEANWYNFQLVAGSKIAVVRKKSGASATLATSGALTAPYWMRMRVTGGTIYFEYADNRATKPNEYGWTVLASEVWNLGVPLTTAEYVYLTSYNTPTTGKTYVTDFEHGAITSLGSNKVKITSYYSGQALKDAVVLTTSGQAYISNLAAGGSKKWDFKMLTGTFTDGVGKTGIITLTSVAH